MSEYIQIGTTAIRDPVNDSFLPAVPLYVKAEDAKKVEAICFDGEIIRSLTAKYAAYAKAERKVKTEKPKKKAPPDKEAEREARIKRMDAALRALAAEFE